MFVNEREPDGVIGACKVRRQQPLTQRIHDDRHRALDELQAGLDAATTESALQKFFAERREYKRRRRERMNRSGKLTQADIPALQKAGRPMPKG